MTTVTALEGNPDRDVIQLRLVDGRWRYRFRIDGQWRYRIGVEWFNSDYTADHDISDVESAFMTNNPSFSLQIVD